MKDLNMKKLTIVSAARKRGISLIEGVLYLVIALAVIVGGIVFFQQAQLSNQVTDTARAGVAMSSQTRGLYQSQRSFGAGDITAALLKSGAVPSNFQGNDGSNDVIVHPFGGNITIAGANTQFTMTLTNMSEAACTRLATVGEGGEGPLGTGIASVAINNATGDALLNPTAVASAATVAAQCADNATIIMTYDR